MSEAIFIYTPSPALIQKYSGLMIAAFASGAAPKLMQNGNMQFRANITMIESNINIDGIVSLVADGVEVYNYPIWLKMPNEKLTDPVIAGLPNYLNRKWENWHDEYHAITDLQNGFSLIPGNGFGEDLTGDEIKIIYDQNDADINIVTYSQAKEILENL